MPPKRNAQGMFTKKESMFGLSKYWTNTILIIISILIVISPWIYIMIKKNALSGMSNTLKDFYENNFSCVCPNITMTEHANGSEKPKNSF